MLNNKKKYLYTTYVLVCQNCTLILNSAGPESEIRLSYVSVVCVYGGRGGEWVLEVLKCFVRGGQNFFYLLCVCVWGGGGGFSYLSFREKNN